MPSLLLRYEDEIENKIASLQKLFTITTKNKTIIEALDNYEELYNQYEQQQQEISQLKIQINDFKSVLLAYKNAKTDLDDLINDFKGDY